MDGYSTAALPYHLHMDKYLAIVQPNDKLDSWLIDNRGSIDFLSIYPYTRSMPASLTLG